MFRTLLVDDSVETLETLALQYNMHSEVELVGLARNISEAKKLCESSKIDLVSIDIQLGTENGFDLCTDLAQQHPHLFLSMCSLEASQSNRQAATRAGASYFLEKPIQLKDIDQMVRYMKEQRNPRSTQCGIVGNNVVDWINCVFDE